MPKPISCLVLLFPSERAHKSTVSSFLALTCSWPLEPTLEWANTQQTHRHKARAEMYISSVVSEVLGARIAVILLKDYSREVR